MKHTLLKNGRSTDETVLVLDEIMLMCIDALLEGTPAYERDRKVAATQAFVCVGICEILGDLLVRWKASEKICNNVCSLMCRCMELGGEFQETTCVSLDECACCLERRQYTKRMVLTPPTQNRNLAVEKNFGVRSGDGISVSADHYKALSQSDALQSIQCALTQFFKDQSTLETSDEE